MEKVATFALSLVRRPDGTVRKFEGTEVYGDEQALFTVTCVQRGSQILLRDTTESEEFVDVTDIYGTNADVAYITKRRFDEARERWENSSTYETSV